MDSRAGRQVRRGAGLCDEHGWRHSLLVVTADGNRCGDRNPNPDGNSHGRSDEHPNAHGDADRDSNADRHAFAHAVPDDASYDTPDCG